MRTKRLVLQQKPWEMVDLYCAKLSCRATSLCAQPPRHAPLHLVSILQSRWPASPEVDVRLCKYLATLQIESNHIGTGERVTSVYLQPHCTQSLAAQADLAGFTMQNKHGSSSKRAASSSGAGRWPSASPNFAWPRSKASLLRQSSWTNVYQNRLDSTFCIVLHHDGCV